jgi:DNA-binding NtrC family response regulator
LRICHETPDDLTALTSVSAWLRDQLRALSVAIYGAAPTAVVVAAASRPRMPVHARTQPPTTAAGDATRIGVRSGVTVHRLPDVPRDYDDEEQREVVGSESRRRAKAIEQPLTSADSSRDERARSLSAGPDAASGDVVRDPGAGSGESHRVIQATLDAYQNENDASASPDCGTVVVRYAVAGSTRILSPALAMRAIDSGLAIPPTYRPDALDAAAPVRYASATIGAIVVRWSIDAALDHTNASALIGAAAAAVSPHLRAAVDREPPDAGHAGIGIGAGAVTATARGNRAGSHSPSQGRTLGLLGISAAMDTLRHTITRVSSVPFHVLIEGESGSGKELVARALHQQGPRRHRRFCAVNCAAFTDELLEAELFGHTRGAFTGALTERPGLFEEADGGTLFLDEIGELSPRGQAKLLRVIQDGETRRIGENLPRRVDTRIIAATNRSLRDEADVGQFRADLLYRLDVIRITVPPLRARPEDVAVLARAFWEEATARLGSRATLDPATLTALARYHWPGNVRELHNAIMALAVHAPPRGRVTPSQLPETISSRAPSGTVHDRAASPVDTEGRLEDARRAFESRYILAALARAGGSPSRAAKALGLTRQGLRKLMARLDLNDAAERRPSPGRTTARKERSPS